MQLDKVTYERERWYDDACGAALAMELLGERWALLIVRELMFGPRRFSELRAGLPGISANVLTQRLERMMRGAIVTRERAGAAQVYALTPWGHAAEPAMLALSRWASRSPAYDPMLFVSPAAMMLSLRTMIDRARAGDMRLTVGFRFGRDGFVARLAGGTLPIERAAPAGEVVFDTDARTLANIFYGKRPIAVEEAAGTLTFGGNRDAAAAFIDLFHLPAKVPPPAAAG